MTYRIDVHYKGHPHGVLAPRTLHQRPAANYYFDQSVYDQIAAHGGLDTRWGHHVANTARAAIYDDDVQGISIMIPFGTVITFERH